MRIVIAEDHVLLADGLSRLLTAYGHDVVAAVTTGPDLITAVTAHRPDVAVVDIRLPPTFTDEGLQAALHLKKNARVPVLILSQYVEATYARELLAATDGVGYLLKDRIGPPREFVDALHRVAAGHTVLDPQAVTQIFAQDRNQQRLRSLTDRERHVLTLMAEGGSNAAIASSLTIAEATVDKHISAIFAKLDLPPSDGQHRRVHAVLTYLNGHERRPDV